MATRGAIQKYRYSFTSPLLSSMPVFDANIIIFIQITL